MSKNEKRSIFEWISVIANIATILGLIIGVSLFVNISNNITNHNSVQNNIDLVGQNKSMEEEIIDAQTYFKGGQYETAKNIYTKWKNSSDIAKVNLGFMYSNGYGAEVNLQEASKYYSQAYYQGNETALTNYLYINLFKPTSYEQTISALRLGYNANNEESIKFLAMLISGELSSKYSDRLKNIASEFWDLSFNEQKALLSNHTISSKEYILKPDNEKIPKDTDFKTYKDVDGLISKGINCYIEVYKQETQSFIWVPVYDVNDYYIAESFRFVYADLLFSEVFIEE